MKKFTKLIVVLSVMLSFFACEGLEILLKIDNLNLMAFVGDYVLDDPDDDLSDFHYFEITGTLHITSTDMSHVNELQYLEHVGGDIIIENNADLTNINGLGYLLLVEGDFIINDNDKITREKLDTVINNIYKRGGWIQGRIIFNGVEIPVDIILVATG